MSRENLKQVINMEIAEAVAKLSTCKYVHVGAVIVQPDSNRIIGTGYNGSAPGQKHCNELTNLSREAHKDWSDKNEIHAEMNAIINAAKNGAATDNCVLYTTVSPCWNCLKHIKTAGINTIYYKTKYWRLDDNEIDFQIESFNVDIVKL